MLGTALVEGRGERAHRSALHGLQRAQRCMHLGGAGVGAVGQGWDVGDRRQRRRAVEGRRSAAAAQALGARIDRAGHVSNRAEGVVAVSSERRGRRRGLPRRFAVVALGFARSESPNTEPQRSNYAIFGIARSEKTVPHCGETGRQHPFRDRPTHSKREMRVSLDRECPDGFPDQGQGTSRFVPSAAPTAKTIRRER